MEIKNREFDMKVRHFRLFILVSISLSIFISGCVYNQEFHKDKLVLSGDKSTIFGIPIMRTQYRIMEIDPFDCTNDYFYIKFPNGRVYSSSEIKIETFKNLEKVVVATDRNIYHYIYHPLSANYTYISITTKDNKTIDRFICFYAQGHNPTPFYFSSAKGNSPFFPMPLTHEQAVKIFGKPDKITSKLWYAGLWH